MGKIKWTLVIGILGAMLAAGSMAFSAYFHSGEGDSSIFLSVYPNQKDSKLDSCALCHSGGQQKDSKGKTVTLGSCQWCHAVYGYDQKGDIKATLNSYGKDYLDQGRNEAALKAIASFDSDRDKYPNLQEIQAGRYPGDANDDPSKKIAPSKIFTKTQLEAMPQHTEFLLMNASRSLDSYVEYRGVPMQDLLEKAGILPSATGIKVYSPDGFSQYHPLDADPNPAFYPVKGVYPPAPYFYNEQADMSLQPSEGWCDYSAPSNKGRKPGEIINIPGGLKLILAIKRDGAYLTPGVISPSNNLDGEGPYRVVPPQKNPGPPDQSSTAKNQKVIWPYNNDWDHNAGSSARTVTIIKVEPLPEGTTDIDILEAGWRYVDQEKIVIYGAIRE